MEQDKILSEVLEVLQSKKSKITRFGSEHDNTGKTDKLTIELNESESERSVYILLWNGGKNVRL